MPVIVQWPGNRLKARVESLKAAAAPTGKSITGARIEIRNAVERDNEDKLFRQVDRYGKPLAKLAKSTLKRRKPGQRPDALIPHGYASRVIQNLSTEWEGDELVVRWTGIHWILYHLTGAKKPGTKWVLPRRDISGITPKGWAEIRKIWKYWIGQITKESKS